MSLNGKQICFTGTLQMKRDDAKAQAEAAGAKVTGSVSANTDILVCGAGVGAKKTDDAQKKGVEVWTEDQFTSVFHVTSSHMSHHHICHIIIHIGMDRRPVHICAELTADASCLQTNCQSE